MRFLHFLLCAESAQFELITRFFGLIQLYSTFSVIYKDSCSAVLTKDFF